MFIKQGFLKLGKPTPPKFVHCSEQLFEFAGWSGMHL